jgi:hypothetical protein
MRRTRAIAAGLIMASVLVAGYGGQSALANGSAEETIMRLEQDWAKAYLTRDTAMLDRILAFDYVALAPGGKFQSKMELMEEIRTGFVRYEAIENGPMSVRVFGNTAVVTGSNAEMSSRLDMDTSGRYTWLDVFVLRDGRWQAVASQGSWVAMYD